MKYLKICNNFFFKRNLSVFDILCLIMVGSACDTSMWFMLLGIPLTMASLQFEKWFTDNKE